MIEAAVEEAVRKTIEENAEMVECWLVDTPKSWGYLAGKAVIACRSGLDRPLSDDERRLVWSQLWRRLMEIREGRDRGRI